jgi:hypothetical protein
LALQRHNEREPSALEEQFGALRPFNLTLWNWGPSADLMRTGRHNERGSESLDPILRTLAGHDPSHLDQVTRLIQAVQLQE